MGQAPERADRRERHHRAARRRLPLGRANASPKSHAELDESTELDLGDPVDLARRYRGLRSALPGLNVLGGCCGTDWRHLRAIRDAWVG